MRITFHRKLWVRLVVVAFPVLLSLDALIGLAYRTNTTADVKISAPRSGTTRRTIVVFPGYAMPGSTLVKAFAPYVADDDAMVVVIGYIRCESLNESATRHCVTRKNHNCAARCA